MRRFRSVVTVVGLLKNQPIVLENLVVRPARSCISSGAIKVTTDLPEFVTTKRCEICL
jgi:hypothetical protein